jgi:hypothetical protein
MVRPPAEIGGTGFALKLILAFSTTQSFGEIQAVAENLFAAISGWRMAAAIPRCAARRLDDSPVR